MIILDVWGAVATASAPLKEISHFCTNHLNQGAGLIYIHLDGPKRDVVKALDSLRKIKVIPTALHYCRRKLNSPHIIE